MVKLLLDRGGKIDAKTRVRLSLNHHSISYHTVHIWTIHMAIGLSTEVNCVCFKSVSFPFWSYKGSSNFTVNEISLCKTVIYWCFGSGEKERSFLYHKRQTPLVIFKTTSPCAKKDDLFVCYGIPSKSNWGGGVAQW